MSHWCASACAVLACLLATVSRAEETPSVSMQLTVPKPTKELPPPAGPDAASIAEGYFALGSWRIGMPREEALGKFGSVEPLKGQSSYRAVAQSHFAADLPADLTFDDDKLRTVKLQVYEGNDLEQAVQRIQQVLMYMNEHFGGANFEGGLKAHKDPEGKLLLRVLRHAIDSVEGGLREVEEDEKKKKKRKRKGQSEGFTAFEMVMNFRCERAAQNNFLLGEFRFRSDSQRINVSLYDDRAFVKSRIPEASVMLFRAAGERPVPASPSAAPPQ
jgi:hypothetical protein